MSNYKYLKMKNPTILGAICGDTIGSVYEFNPTKNYHFELLRDDMIYTDDSIMTIAVADWIVHDPSLSHDLLVKAMRWYGQKEPCPMGGYGGGFLHWLMSNAPKPYNSWGNGSAMRVAAVGFAFDTLEETLRVAKISAEVTHNHPEGIKGAQATAAAIFMARNMATKIEICDYIEQTFGYDLHRSYADVKDDYKFEESCQKTVPEAIIAFLESTDYVDALRLAVALGGDADTIGAITGAIAAAYYREIPDEVVELTLKRMPEHLRIVVDSFNLKYGGGVSSVSVKSPKCGVTPEHIRTLMPNQIFVFGSNLMGHHGGGAARAALDKFGAVWGVGVGIQGQSYAIPTMQGPVQTIRPYVDQFIEYAAAHTEQHFLVTAIGCGIAGFRPGEIAPLFAKALDMENVSLPKRFIEILTSKRP